MQLIDTHLHLDHEQFQEDLPEVLARAREAGVVQVITIGSNLATSERAVELAETYPEVYAAVGVHPHDASEANEATYHCLREWARHPRVVAIGEIGLDFYYEHSPRAVQREVFLRQLELAREVGLPAVIHDRDAHEEVEAVLRETWERGGGEPLRVVLHSFTGSLAMARRCAEWGCYFSTGGMITFKNAEAIRSVINQIPLDRLMLETDAPYLSPEPYRGRRNEPARVAVIAAYLAQLRGVDTDVVAAVTTGNARAFFGLPEV